METLFGGHASWFVFPALVGTGYLLLQMVLGQFGGDGGLDLDMDVDVDVDSNTGEVAVISLQTVSAFLLGFGWMGFAAYRFLEIGFTGSAVIGLASGFGVAWLMVTLLKMLMRIQTDANVSITQAVGLTGSVYARVPPKGEGRGEVVLVIGSGEHRFRAIQERTEPIDRHARVRVVRANVEDNTVVVEQAV